MFLKSGRVSYGGMITAAMVVLLYLSCVFENCSLFCLAAAAFLGGVTTWQRGWKDGLLISAAAGVLGVVLLPNKWYVLTYAAFVLYVFAWECLEHFFSKKQRMLAWILKGILYHVLLISAVCSYVYVFGFQQLVQGFLLTVFQHSKILFGLTAVLLAEVVWIAFDRAYAVFRIKWSQWMHRAGADGSSRLSTNR